MAFDKSRLLKLIKQGRVSVGGKKADKTILDKLVKPKKCKQQKQVEKEIAEAKQKAFVLLCEQKGLPIPQPEYQFNKNRKWRIDYYFERNGLKVGLEVEGGVWTNGRHTRGSGFVKDMEKYNSMALHNIFLLRIQPKDLGLKAIELLKKMIQPCEL